MEFISSPLFYFLQKREGVGLYIISKHWPHPPIPSPKGKERCSIPFPNSKSSKSTFESKPNNNRRGYQLWDNISFLPIWEIS
jgi:hypothetical protein